MKSATHAISLVVTVSTMIAIQSVRATLIDATDPRTSSRPAAPASEPASTANIKIDNFNFQPRELKIAAGTKVTWQNADDVPHTATSKDDPQAFDSGVIDTDDKFSFTFTKPGKYAYYCKVHPHMTGVIIVK